MDGLEGEFRKLSIESLQAPHREIFSRAVSNILSSQIAEDTYAQIIDGLPLSHVVLDVSESNACPGHPLIEEHKELCAGVLDKAKELHSTFDMGLLEIDSRLIHAFQAASPGSRAFNTRLIELAAVAVHQIAVKLFKTSSSLHTDDKLGRWRPSDDLIKIYYPLPFPETLFNHAWYRYHDQYPEGVADMVGYWAESRIFGGVVLFDRREPDSAPDVDSSAIYLHPDRRHVTYRIYRLLDDQKRQLVDFLLSDITPPAACTIPILGDLNNRHRVDPEEKIMETGIYRDKWERRQCSIRVDRRYRDVIDLFNYNTQEEWDQSRERYNKRPDKPIRTFGGLIFPPEEN